MVGTDHPERGVPPDTVQGIRSVLRRRWLSNTAFTTVDHLVRTVRHGLREIQYRSDLINGCPAGAELRLHPT